MNDFAGPDILLALVIAAQVGGGLYMLLERTLTRIALGVVMIGNGVNLLFLAVSGPPGEPPLANIAEPADMADPLPQALVLTAIVITLAVTSFLVAMAYRSWQLNEHDEVQDDLEDRRILLALAVEAEIGSEIWDQSTSLDEEAAGVRDETEFDENWLAGDDDFL